MLRTILVFFDGSAESRKAFDLGLVLAAKHRAKLVVAGVMPAVEAEAMLDRGEDCFSNEFQRLCEEAGSKGIRCQYRLDVGDPVRQLAHAAKDHAADLILVGQRRLTEATESRAGSQAERIMRYVDCPVTVIK
jgi:nucleotide-binding universal stress UspA family protein